MSLPLPAVLNPDPLPRTAKRITDALARLRHTRQGCAHDPFLETCVRCDTETALLNVAIEYYGDLLAWAIRNGRKVAADL